MHRTQKLATFEDEPRGGTLIMIASVLVVLGVGYVILLMHPELVKGLGSFFHVRVAPSGSASWVAPSFAAGVAIGGASLGVYVLSHFVKGVQRAPYVWLAPVLVGFSCLVLARASVQLPLPGLQVSWFAALTALLWLGGGAILQQPGWQRRVAGALLLTLPVAVVVGAHVQHVGGFAQAWPALGAPGRFFAFVLLLSWLGVGFMAIVTQDRRTHRVFEDAEYARASLGDAQTRIAELTEHAHRCEFHAAEAEQRAALAEQQLTTLSQAPGGAFDEQGFAELAKPKLSLPIKLSAIVIVLTGVAAAAYFGVYYPMAKRLGQLSAAGAVANEKHAAEIDSLRKHFEAQRTALSGSVAAEREKSAQALAELEAARAQLAASQANDVAPESAGAAEKREPAPKAKPRRRARSKAAKRPAEKAGRPSSARSGSDDAALRGGVDDDPIGGLL